MYQSGAKASLVSESVQHRLTATKGKPAWALFEESAMCWFEGGAQGRNPKNGSVRSMDFISFIFGRINQASFSYVNAR